MSRSKSIILQMGGVRFEGAGDMPNVPQLVVGRAKTNLGLLISSSVLFFSTMCSLNLEDKQGPANKGYSLTIFSLIIVNKLYFTLKYISKGV